MRARAAGTVGSGAEKDQRSCVKEFGPNSLKLIELATEVFLYLNGGDKVDFSGSFQLDNLYFVLLKKSNWMLI